MEHNRIVELSVREDSDLEELKKPDTSKASNLEMRKDKTTSSPSESKEFLIDIYDPEEPKKANTDKVSTMTEVKCPNEDLNREELKELVMQVKSIKTLIQENLKMPRPPALTPPPPPPPPPPPMAMLHDFDLEEIQKAHTLKTRNQEPELIRKYTTASSCSESVKEIKCCIYEVPRDLRKINKKAFTPRVVSIGPLHYEKHYLIEMESQKLIYEKKFIERAGKDRLEEFKSYIRVHEGKIRACYAKNFHFGSHEFVKIILRDVVFIFELFLRNDQQRTRSEFDMLLDTPIRKAAIRLHLQLLENQLPYFVLKELFLRLGDSAKPSGGEQFPDPFLILALRFFYDSDQGSHIYSRYNLQHFTDLRRCFLLKEFIPPGENKEKHIRDLRCASKLHGSGVKFKERIGGRSSLEIRCEYKERPLQMMPCIKLQELVLEIPRFEVDDGTECLMRNVMAFELLHYPWETHVCNYIHLMDSLIDTEKDVDLLVEKGIIFHGLGDNAAVANMFNKLSLQVTPSYSCYFDIGEKLKAHYRKRWNHAKATLTRVYFSDPWIATGTVAAALLLLLTLVQTVCSILQVL